MYLRNDPHPKRSRPFVKDELHGSRRPTRDRITTDVEPGQNTKLCARSAVALSLYFPCWRAASRPRAQRRASTCAWTTSLPCRFAAFITGSYTTVVTKRHGGKVSRLIPALSPNSFGVRRASQEQALEYKYPRRSRGTMLMARRLVWYSVAQTQAEQGASYAR